MKSSISIASSGLWLPLALRMKIIAVGTPAAAKAAASCDAPDGISIDGIPSAVTPRRSLALMPSSRMPGAARVNRPRSKRTRRRAARSEEHTSELQSLMRISYAVFCLKKKKKKPQTHNSKHIKLNTHNNLHILLNHLTLQRPPTNQHNIITNHNK